MEACRAETWLHLRLGLRQPSAKRRLQLTQHPLKYALALLLGHTYLQSSSGALICDCRTAGVLNCFKMLMTSNGGEYGWCG